MNNFFDKNQQGELNLAKNKITFPKKRERRYIMVKKMKTIAIVTLMLFGVVALTARTPEEDEIVAKGTFYSLQEAYDRELKMLY